MKVTIHGPNLIDQNKGTFHVHSADCRDNDKEIARNGSEYPWTAEVSSVEDLVMEIYGDQINEGADYESCESDIYFEPCTKELS